MGHKTPEQKRAASRRWYAKKVGKPVSPEFAVQPRVASTPSIVPEKRLKVDPATGLKICSKCATGKPDDQFYAKKGQLTSACRLCYRKFYIKPYVHKPQDSMKSIQRTIVAANLNHAVGLRERVKELLARKGLRRPEYVARQLGITVDAATVLMFDGSEPVDESS